MKIFEKIKKSWVPLGKLFLSIGITWILIHYSRLDPSLLKKLIQTPGTLVSILIIFVAMIFINALRWKILNDAQNIHLTLSQTISLTYIGTACNNLLPGATSGDLVRFLLLSRHQTYQKSKLLISILFDRLTGLAAIFLALSFIILGKLNLLDNFKIYMLLISFLLISLSFVLLFIILFLTPSLQKIKNIMERFNSKSKLMSILLSIIEGVVTYKGHKLKIINCLALSLLIQVFNVIIIAILAKIMLSLSLPYYMMGLAILVTQIINLVPLTPGGFGMGELAFANMIISLNPLVFAPYASIYLAYRLLGIITYMPGILIFFTSLKPKIKPQLIINQEIA